MNIFAILVHLIGQLNNKYINLLQNTPSAPKLKIHFKIDIFFVLKCIMNPIAKVWWNDTGNVMAN